MTTNKSTTDVAGFIEAVENDEYAQLELPTLDVLITDWEGDGVFYPYVQPELPMSGELPDDKQESLEWEIADNIEELLDVEVRSVEWSPKNGVFYPDMDRPE